MIVVGDIVEIVGGGLFNGRTTEVLEIVTYGDETVYRLDMAPLVSMEVLCLAHEHEIRLVKEHKVLQILRTWRDSRLETE